MRALGVDYGRKRVGLALSDASGMLARPWKTLAVAGIDRQAGELAREVEALAAESDGLSVVVIGLPRRLSGEATSRPPRSSSWPRGSDGTTAVPIVLQDERLTSHEAEELLSQAGKGLAETKVAARRRRQRP